MEYPIFNRKYIFKGSIFQPAMLDFWSVSEANHQFLGFLSETPEPGNGIVLVVTVLLGGYYTQRIQAGQMPLSLTIVINGVSLGGSKGS